MASRISLFTTFIALLLATLTWSKPLRRSMPPHWTTPQNTTSSSWAGAVIGDAGGVVGVSATVTIPNITYPANYNPATAYEGGLWVGIDGWGSCEKLLQVLIRWHLYNGAVTYHASHQWAPDEATMHDMPLTLQAGDSVTLSVRASSDYGSTGGDTHVVNHSTGQSCDYNYQNQAPLLCQQYAAVVVEKFSGSYGTDPDHRIPFPDFGAVMFQDISYTRVGGVTAAMGNDLDMVESPNAYPEFIDTGTLKVTAKE